MKNGRAIKTAKEREMSQITLVYCVRQSSSSVSQIFSLVETGKGPPTSTPSSSLLEVLVWLRLGACGIVLLLLDATMVVPVVESWRKHQQLSCKSSTILHD